MEKGTGKEQSKTKKKSRKRIRFPEEDYNNGALIDEYGIKYSADGKRLLEATNKKITFYSVRPGTTRIEEYAFSQCRSLRRIILPNGLVRIGKRAFAFCYSLDNIETPSSLKVIETAAFIYCSSLLYITIPKDIAYIDERVFYGCKSLRQIYIPKNCRRLVKECLEFTGNQEEVKFLREENEDLRPNTFPVVWLKTKDMPS